MSGSKAGRKKGVVDLAGRGHAPGIGYSSWPSVVTGESCGELVEGMRLTVVTADRTHPGRVRKINEDAVTVSSPIFAVADGMGGHNSGDVASSIVAGVLGGLGREGPHTEAGIRGALELANRRIRRETPQDDEFAAAGTTVVGVLIAPERSFAFNVGDSRLYMRRRGTMRQLSKDHSVVQELVDMGEIHAEDAGRHEQRNVITRAVGIEPVLEVDLWELEPESGDRYLLASDGLSGELSDAAIAEILASHDDPDAAADALIAAALANGGRDNVSVIVVDIHGADEEEPDAVDAAEDAIEARSGDTTERRRRRAAIATSGDTQDD